MPYFKCPPCRTRLYTSAAPADGVGNLCPECGTLLEPVAALEEIVGFRAIEPRGDSPADAGSELRVRSSDEVGDLTARRKELAESPARIEAAFAAGQWDDDGGGRERRL